MKKQFTGKEKIGDVVVAFPGAAELFKQYKVDFCCGGDRQLAAVLEEQGIAREELIDTLNHLFFAAKQEVKTVADWNSASFAALIEHIINTHHAFLNRELPTISDLLTKILRVHGTKHRELNQVHKLFHLLKMDLEQHLISEEVELYPAILAYEAEQTGKTRQKALELIDTIESEHDHAGDILKELDALTGHYQLPADACASFALAYRKLNELESDLFQHIHLENNILHPRFAQTSV